MFSAHTSTPTWRSTQPPNDKFLIYWHFSGQLTEWLIYMLFKLCVFYCHTMFVWRNAWIIRNENTNRTGGKKQIVRTLSTSGEKPQATETKDAIANSRHHIARLTRAYTHKTKYKLQKICLCAGECRRPCVSLFITYLAQLFLHIPIEINIGSKRSKTKSNKQTMR